MARAATRLYAFLLLLALFLQDEPVSAYLRPRQSRTCSVRRRNALSSMQRLHMQTDKQAQEEMREKLSSSDFEGAYNLLKRNPLITLSEEDGRIFLNNIRNLVPKDIPSLEEEQQQKVDSSLFIYKRLARQNVLRAFGCVDNAYPERAQDISQQQLEDITGLSITALTPKRRGSAWTAAGVGVFMAEYILGNAIGVDPLFTIIPISFFLFGLDQLTNKGAYFEIVYRKLFPEYEAKVIAHEAGHFLVSYILGVAVSECVTSALDAKNFPEIRGQAGTIFHDSRLADEMKTNKVTKASLDRLSVVLMAGIAAEGLMFGNAEGGVLDEEALFALYAPVRPPWNVLRIQAKARWAATQALLLIKEHRASYDALVEALSNGAGVGDCVRVIEDNLPKELPSTVRIQERERKKRDSELASVLGFVRRMTYKVGGIEAATAGDDANLAVNKDGTVNRRSDMGGSGGIESRGVVPTGGLLVADADSMEDGSEEVRSVDTISSRVEQLKDVTRTGKLDVTENEDGGIWLNNLDTLKNKQAINPVNVVDEETPADVMSTQGEVVSMEDLPQVAAELKEVPENVEGTVDAVLGNVGNAQDAEVSQNELENLPPQIMYKQIILPAPVDGYLDELEALNGTLTEEDREFLMNSGEANGELSGVTESDAADGAADAANAAMPEVQGEEDKPTESNVDMFGAASRNTPASRGETAVRSADATATEAERSASKEKYGAAVDLIQSGRGWQLKRLENEEAFNRKRVQEISARIASLEGRDQDGSVDAETKELASSGSKTETDSQ